MDNLGQRDASSSHNGQREYIVNQLDHGSMTKVDESVGDSDGEGGVPLCPRSLRSQSFSTDPAGHSDILHEFQALSLSNVGLQETTKEKSSVQRSASTVKKAPWFAPRPARSDTLNPEVSSFRPRRTQRRRGTDCDYPGVDDAAAHPGGSAVSRKALADPNGLLNVDLKRKSHRYMHNMSVMAPMERNATPRGYDSTLRSAPTTDVPTAASTSSEITEQHATASEQAAQGYPMTDPSPEAPFAQAIVPYNPSPGQPTQEMATPHTSDYWQQYVPDTYDFLHASEDWYAYHVPPRRGFDYRSRVSAGPTAIAPSPPPAPPHRQQSGNSVLSGSTLPTLPNSGALGGMETRRQFGSNIIPSNRNIATEVGGPVGSSSSSRGGNSRRRRARTHELPRPKPTRAYLEKARETPTALDDSRRLLVILDLNGTLGDRKGSKSAFHPRPGCDAFIKWLFDNHCVLIWSSAKQDNVERMSKKIMSPEQLASPSFAGTWSRKDLNLTEEQSRQKIVVYKQLSWVWREPDVQISQPVPGARWDQTNTVLIDDTEAKGAAEPHNLIIVPEFTAGMDEDTHLLHVQEYLSGLSHMANVSAAMRANPFKPIIIDNTAALGGGSLRARLGRSS